MAILEGVPYWKLGLGMIEWCPFAERRLGPRNKFGGYQAGNSGPKRGEVKHSAVGFLGGLWSVLDGPAKKSWHFTVAYDGTIYQHYEVSAHCWHAGDSDGDGGVAANIELVGVEHEGGPIGNESEPLHEAQIDATTRLTRWLADGREVRRYPDQLGVWTLAEHNQVSDSFTACPSHRIPWAEILRRLQQPAQGQPLKALIAAAFIESIGRPITDLGPEDAAAFKAHAAKLV